MKWVKVIYYHLLSASSKSLNLTLIGPSWSIFLCLAQSLLRGGQSMPISSGLKGTHTHTEQIGFRKRKNKVFLTKEREINADKVSEAEEDA